VLAPLLLRLRVKLLVPALLEHLFGLIDGSTVALARNLAGALDDLLLLEEIVFDIVCLLRHILITLLVPEVSVEQVGWLELVPDH